MAGSPVACVCQLKSCCEDSQLALEHPGGCWMCHILSRQPEDRGAAYIVLGPPPKVVRWKRSYYQARQGQEVGHTSARACTGYCSIVSQVTSRAPGDQQDLSQGSQALKKRSKELSEG